MNKKGPKSEIHTGDSYTFTFVSFFRRLETCLAPARREEGLPAVILDYLSSDSQLTSRAHSHIAVGREMRATFLENNLDIYHFVQ